MYELKKKLERYLRVNLLGPGPRLMQKEFTGPRSHKGWETLAQNNSAPTGRIFIKFRYLSVFSKTCREMSRFINPYPANVGNMVSS